MSVPWIGPANLGLFTDFYELTMAAVYVRRGLTHRATFDLFVRSLPPQRRFLIAAGLDDALDILEQYRIDGEAIAYLEDTGRFEPGAVEALSGLAFTGDVWAAGEGEAVFAQEPILRITAPLPEAQLVETVLLNTVSFQTMIASKAARIAIAADPATFVDFSARRDHGADSALRGARASYIGGAAATSMTLAGKEYGIPVSGTMAHSFVTSYNDEAEAFEAYTRAYPDNAVLLIDTYDSITGARTVVDVAAKLARDGLRIQGVRLDSGNLDHLARQVRDILDAGGLGDVQIFVSGDLDEYRIAELRGAGVPIDAYGVGTRLGTSADAPNLGAVYKLVHDAEGPKAKLSEGKVTLPGIKQVYRHWDDGEHAYDLIALDDEDVTTGRPLLSQVMAGGRRLQPRHDLGTLRARATTTVAALPSRLRTLQGRERPYDVQVSDALRGILGGLRR